MSDWKEIKRPFRDALISAFTWNRLTVVLQYHCDRRLDRITSESEGFDTNVDEVIASAVRDGWLEKLAQGALAENKTHAGLLATVPQIVTGVADEGTAYYQGVTAVTQETPLEPPRMVPDPVGNEEEALSEPDDGFSELLRGYKSSSQSSYSELSRRSYVPRSTIANWVKGTRPQRRRWQDIVRLAASLNLEGREVDRLLFILLLPPVRELYKISAYEEEDELTEILGQWVDALDVPKLRVFLCHAMADKVVIRSLYRKLLDDNLDPWLDEVNLLPGMAWESEIVKAVCDSDVILVFLSQQAVTARGFMQKEIRVALDVAEQQPEDAVFLIPVRLEPCEVPERLGKYQWLNLYEEDGYDRLLQALQLRGDAIGKTILPN